MMNKKSIKKIKEIFFITQILTPYIFKKSSQSIGSSIFFEAFGLKISVF
jgi:hypothetical protein